MTNRTLRSWTLASAVATYLLVVMGAVARAAGVHEGLAAYGYRVGALAVISLSLGAAVSGGRRLLRAQPGFALGNVLVALLAVPALLGDFAAIGLPAGATALHPTLLAALVATWLAATVFAGGAEPFHSRLSVFRSQWQVPLYAALASYAVVMLGTYLRSLGQAGACQGWPLCGAGLPAPLAAAHLAQRLAALLASGLLVYTVGFVWGRHKDRPALLVLTGTAIVLFTVEVLLGADAARGTLGEAGMVAHLAVAAALVGTLVVLAAVGYYAPSLPAIAGASAEAGVGAAALPGVRSVGETFRDYLALTKPRILVLLLITGYAAMWVAAGGLPNVGLSAVAMLGLAMSCGAANAINMWYDRDIDSVMNRTKKRPLPAGRLTPGQVLAFGVMTGALSFVLLAFLVNLMTALLSLAGLLFYVCIYTMWLKRSTTQNIVIGGAAGAVPPLVGWAAVTGQVSWASLAMFLIVFMWTPPHFWALALFRNEDYRRAKVPMLPVVKGEMHTKWQILLYSALMIPSTAALYWTGVVGEAYLWVSTALGLSMVVSSLVLLRERLPAQKWAVRTFIWSIFWLGIVFAAMMLDVRA
jgi:heme o synthase